MACDWLHRLHVDDSPNVCSVPEGCYACSLMMSSMMASPAPPVPAPPPLPSLQSTIDCTQPQWSLLFYLIVTLTLADDEEIREGAEITCTGWLENCLPFSQSSSDVCVEPHILITHTHTRVRATSATALNIIAVSLAPASLTAWQLN